MSLAPLRLAMDPSDAPDELALMDATEDNRFQGLGLRSWVGKPHPTPRFQTSVPTKELRSLVGFEEPEASSSELHLSMVRKE